MDKKEKKSPPKFKQALNSLYSIMDYVFRIVMLNLLIVVPALLPFLIYSYIAEANETVHELIGYATLLPAAIYMFPAIVASVDVLRQYEDKTTKGVFKEYFKALFKHFIKSFVISIIIFIILALLIFDFTINDFHFQGALLYFINNLDQIPCLFGLAITISFMIMGLIILLHIPLVMTYFDGLSIIQYLKLAFIMAFKKIGKTLIILVITILFIFIDIAMPVATFIAGISLPLFLIVKLSFKEYIKLYRKVEEKENEKTI